MPAHPTLAPLVWLSLLGTLGCAGTAPEPAQGQGLLPWARRQVAPIEQLAGPLPGAAAEVLDAAVADAQIVGLGDSRHDTRQQLQLKALFTRHLIEDLGFRILILEESFPHAEALDAYVRRGEGDPDRILAELAGWYLWSTDEMLAMVEWIRDFNLEHADDPVAIFGMDVTAAAPGVGEVLAALEKVHRAEGLDPESLGLDLYEGDFWPVIWQRHQALDAERKAQLDAGYRAVEQRVADARQALVAAFGQAGYRRLARLAAVARAGNALFTAPDRASGGAAREEGMARTALWVLEQAPPQARAVLWSHNLHVARAPFRMEALADTPLEPMGIALGQALGSGYVAICGSFGTGHYGPEFPPGEREFEPLPLESFDGALAAVGERAFLLDLRAAAAEPGAARWLSAERAWRAQDASATVRPADACDLVYYVDSITRARPTDRALGRYAAMGGG